MNPRASSSLIVQQLRSLWSAARKPILDRFPAAPGRPADEDSRRRYLEHVKDIYVKDAFHSLSVDGKNVPRTLIHRVKTRSWETRDPGGNESSTDHLAARGYWQAATAVWASVGEILNGAPAGECVRNDHEKWHHQLVEPHLADGVSLTQDPRGYRDTETRFEKPRHVPPPWEVVGEAMSALFDLIKKEPEPAVRAIAGHWLFYHVQPFPDGNGRMARFVMNALLASGGYPWTTIRGGWRNKYLAELEAASVEQRIASYADFMNAAMQEEKILLGQF